MTRLTKQTLWFVAIILLFIALALLMVMAAQ
jgi:cytochrome c-type biogenesis protein CcmE